MMRCALGLLFCLVLSVGCAASMQQVGSDSGPPLAIVALRKEVGSERLRPIGEGEEVAVTEEPTIEVKTNPGAWVSAVLYAAAGASQELVLDTQSSRDGGVIRFQVPRRAPPGVRESELRVVVVASNAELPPWLRQLLRLPCVDADRRGDPDPEDRKAPKERKQDKESSNGNGKPAEGGPRGGESATAVCASPIGLTAPVTIRTLTIRSQ